MYCKLTFKYEFGRDVDDFGWLSAHLETPDFIGRNGTWVQWQDIRDFAASLTCYPISADAPVTGEWGFSQLDKNTVTKVIIKPFGATGGLAVVVSLANDYQPINRCTAQFETDYPSLARFREEIERMMDQRFGSASLEGSSVVR